METNALIAILVSSFLSAAVTIGNVAFNYSKDKKRLREKAWELAEKLTLDASDKLGRSIDEGDAIELMLHFNLTYRAALLVAEGKEEELRKLCQQFPLAEAYVSRYMLHHSESTSQDVPPG